jgi:hypothetical protein
MFQTVSEKPLTWQVSGWAFRGMAAASLEAVWVTSTSSPILRIGEGLGPLSAHDLACQRH